MGVSGLYPNLKRLLIKYKLLRNKYPAYVSSLALDMNAIIHPISQLTYAYGQNKDPNRTVEYVRSLSPEAQMNDFYNTFFSALTTIIKSANPRDLLILAVDGPSPQGKIAQQRQRRFVSGTFAKEGATFDPSSITPGTEFMIQLDDRIARWLQDNINIFSAGFPPKVIYSNHLVQGEGEHKILDIYRDPATFNFQDKTKMTGHHVIYGNDADLILLAAILPLDKLINVRAVPYRPREDELAELRKRADQGDHSSITQIRKLDASEENTLSKLEYLDIDEFRKGIREIMNHSKFKNDGIHDFVALMSLLGNDFIPGLFAFRNMRDSIDLMVTLYRQLKKPLTKFHKKSGVRKYHWANFKLFLDTLNKTEPSLLNQITIKQSSKYPYTYPSRLIQAATTISSKKGKNVTIVRYDLFRTYWYINALGPRGDAELMEKLLGEDSTQIQSEQIVSMCIDYLTTLAWIYLYYQAGTSAVSSDWVYRHFHAPMISDLNITASSIDESKLLPYVYDETSIQILPIFQLLAVMPPTSAALLPPEARILQKPESPISYLYPQKFIYELEAHNRHHEGTAIIPFADMVDIQAAVIALGNMTYADLLTQYLTTLPQDATIERSRDVSEKQAKRKIQMEIIKEESDRQYQAKVQMGLIRGGRGTRGSTRGVSDRGSVRGGRGTTDIRGGRGTTDISDRGSVRGGRGTPDTRGSVRGRGTGDTRGSITGLGRGSTRGSNDKEDVTVYRVGDSMPNITKNCKWNKSSNLM